MSNKTHLSILVLIACGVSFAQAADTLKVEWRFEVTHDQRRDLPSSGISLVVNGQAIVISPKVIASFKALQPNQYQTYGVPKDALAACHGWWAGVGDDYYVIRHDGSLFLYHRELSEQTTIPRYKLSRRIPISKNK